MATLADYFGLRQQKHISLDDVPLCQLYPNHIPLILSQVTEGGTKEYNNIPLSYTNIVFEPDVKHI